MVDAGVLRGAQFAAMDELSERAARAATGMAAVGVGPGDTIGLLLRNDHPFFEASFAAAALGAAPVPVNWHGSAEEVAYVLDDAGAKVLVAHADLLAGIRGALRRDIKVLGVETPDDVVAAYQIAGRDCVLPDDVEPWPAWRDGFEARSDRAYAEPLSMIYTSGTTGRPKGVRRLPGRASAEEVSAYLVEALGVLGLAAGMRTVITGPMYHSAPNFYALTAARLGAFVVLQTRFDPEEFLALIERHQITAVHMVPTMFVRLLRLPAEVRDRYDLSSLVHVVHAAAPCPPDIKRAIIDWLGPIVYEYYGGTETSAVVGCNSDQWLSHPGTVGRPLKTCTVRILADDGTPLAVGEPGEVFMRASGFHDFTYQGRPAARAEAERDGLVTCGDIGYLDPDGYLHLCDRKRDMIISGGVNIYPAEIEACMATLDGIRDNAVFGIPDDEYGESVAAAVALESGADLTADDIRAHVRAHLAAFKAPKTIEFLDELPREDSGKIFKRKLRAPYWADTGRTI